jgi:tol-pal system protein YbgF
MIRPLLAALCLAAFAQATHAALFDDEEARKRIAATNERIDRLQKDVEARLTTVEQLSKGQGIELQNQLEAMKADLARIRGQIEVLLNELDQQQKRQRDLYVDLDSRLRKLETPAAAAVPPAPEAAGTGTPPAPGAVAATPGASPSPEQRAYDAALEQFKRGDFPASIAGFSAFVKAYPKSPLAASAQYWVGNAQFARKDYRASIAAQRELVKTYPDSQKIPDALLNIASAQSELGDNAQARRTLEELIAKYPQSEAAGKAKQRLGLR